MSWPPDQGDAWVFAYGSLMWNPCFACVETRRAILQGWHRALCILSIVNRGTPERPGLALGLDQGGSCAGFALRIAAVDVASARERLWEREMARGAYLPLSLPVCLDDGRQVPALVFASRPGHPQYVGHLSETEAAALVAQGVGAYGTALDYLRDVVRHLEALDVGEGPLHRILSLAEARARRDDEIGGREPR